MARFLCQLCYTLVHYGETHPGFYYGNDEDYYTIPQLLESEETDMKHDGMREKSHAVNMTDSSMKLSSNIRIINAEKSLEPNSKPAKNEQISFFPTLKQKRKHFPGSSNNAHFKTFRDGSLLHLTAEYPACEVNSSGNVATQGTVCSEQAFESSKTNAFAFEKKELREFQSTRDDPDTSISSQVAPESLSSKGNVEVDSKQSDKYMEDAASLALPSGCSQRLPTRAENRKYTGDMCSKQFKSDAGLVRHYRTNRGEKRFKCDICGKQFIYKSYLVRHNLSHTGEKPFACEFCEKKFTFKGGLEDHCNIHKGEKPFVCAICNKGFASKSNLSSHGYSHTEVKAFKCGVCGKGFKRNRDRNRHQKEKHPDACQ